MAKLQTFIEYLIQTGWDQVTYQDPRILVFMRKVDGEDQLVSLPASQEYSDYNFRINNAIQRLATCEKISVEQARRKVSGEMLLSAEDIMQVLRDKLEENRYPEGQQPENFDIVAKMARFHLLEELLEGIKEWDDRLIEP